METLSQNPPDTASSITDESKQPEQQLQSKEEQVVDIVAQITPAGVQIDTGNDAPTAVEIPQYVFMPGLRQPSPDYMSAQT